MKPDDRTLHNILSQSKVIAVVGHSDKPDRTSYQIAQFLRSVGYTVYPVNPMVQEIDGQPSYANLKTVPEPIDIVNVFRRSEFLSEVVEEAIEVQARTVWAQLGVSDRTAALKAQQAGLNVIMDACLKVEYLRLGI
ncbi:CoA-binding protein [filamentous cyanobacterium CCP1]|nr:CoA-binding protein [filamentous cyanobacterium CCP2]PSB61098.1 CoA-binding protein [filamentous cyanobacterium CCP1]